MDMSAVADEKGGCPATVGNMASETANAAKGKTIISLRIFRSLCYTSATSLALLRPPDLPTTLLLRFRGLRNGKRLGSAGVIFCERRYNF